MNLAMYEGTRATKKITKKPMAFGWTLASLISARSCSPLVHCAAFAQTLMAALKLMPNPWMTSYLRTFSGHQASKRQRDCLRLSASRPLSWLHPLGPRSIVFYGADTSTYCLSKPRVLPGARSSAITPPRQTNLGQCKR